MEFGRVEVMAPWVRGQEEEEEEAVFSFRDRLAVVRLLRHRPNVAVHGRRPSEHI